MLKLLGSEIFIYLKQHKPPSRIGDSHFHGIYRRLLAEANMSFKIYKKKAYGHVELRFCGLHVEENRFCQPME